MSTTHYSPSASAADTEDYVRGKDDERGVVITSDVPGGRGAFSARARALTQNTPREVEVLHYRQSFSAEEFDPNSPEDLQRVNDLGYLLAKRMHPHADCLVVTHVDGVGGKPHNHIIVINHDSETGRALSDYRTHKDRPEIGRQHGVQSANDQLMREQGLSVVQQPKTVPKDWEIRREDFATDGLDRQMGDRMNAALFDPRAVDKAGLEAVIAEQNEQVGEDGDRVPRMRLVSSRNKKSGAEVWTLKIQDTRDESRRKERRATCSRLSTDFTPDEATQFFQYHQQRQKKIDDERRIRADEEAAAERAERIAARAREAGRLAAEHAGLDPLGGRLPERPARRGEPAAEPPRGAAAGDGLPTRLDYAGIRRDAQRVLDDREARRAAERDREDAARARQRDRWGGDHRSHVVPDHGSEPDHGDDELEF